MTIVAKKIDEDAFDDLFQLVENFHWLRHLMTPLMELWNFCDYREQQELLKALFQRFTFLDFYRLEQISISIFEKIKLSGINSCNTIIAAIADPKDVDGSTAGLQFLKNKFLSTLGWQESNFVPSITQAANEIHSNFNLFLFDDFIGSGKTFLRKLNYLISKLKERKVALNSISIIAFAGMELGISRICSEHKIEIICPVTLKRGISDFDSPDVVESSKEFMRKLEAKLSPKYRKLKLEDHSLGYKESETLFQIQGYNCPNNLFPIFWWPFLLDKTERRTLFRRLR